MTELKKCIVIKKTKSVKTGISYVSAFLRVGNSYDKMLNVDKYGVMLLLNMSPTEIESLPDGFISKEFILTYDS